jgi:hypothetical protein
MEFIKTYSLLKITIKVGIPLLYVNGGSCIGKDRQGKEQSLQQQLLPMCLTSLMLSAALFYDTRLMAVSHVVTCY